MADLEFLSSFLHKKKRERSLNYDSNTMPGTPMGQTLSGHFSAVAIRFQLNRTLLGASTRARICRMPSTQPRTGGAGLMGVFMNM